MEYRPGSRTLLVIDRIARFVDRLSTSSYWQCETMADRLLTNGETVLLGLLPETCHRVSSWTDSCELDFGRSLSFNLLSRLL